MRALPAAVALAAAVAIPAEISGGFGPAMELCLPSAPLVLGSSSLLLLAAGFLLERDGTGRPRASAGDAT